jgi:heme-degrading monooxygenase HmoA
VTSSWGCSADPPPRAAAAHQARMVTGRYPSPVIARTWRGWATETGAEDYQRHYQTEVAAHLRQVPGFLGAQLLRSIDGELVLFTSITWFSGMDAVRDFTGDADPEQAVVEGAARRALTRWDQRASHHEVAVHLPG